MLSRAKRFCAFFCALLVAFSAHPALADTSSTIVAVPASSGCTVDPYPPLAVTSVQITGMPGGSVWQLQGTADGVHFVPLAGVVGPAGAQGASLSLSGLYRFSSSSFRAVQLCVTTGAPGTAGVAWSNTSNGFAISDPLSATVAPQAGSTFNVSASSALPITVRPGSATANDYSGAIASTSVSQNVAGADTNTVGMFFINEGTHNMWLSVTGVPAVASQPSIVVGPGVMWSPPFGYSPSASVYVLGTAGDTFVFQRY